MKRLLLLFFVLAGCQVGNNAQITACFNACKGVQADDGYIVQVYDDLSVKCQCTRYYKISPNGNNTQEISR